MGLGVWSQWVTSGATIYMQCYHIWGYFLGVVTFGANYVCILPYNSAWGNASSWKEVIFSVHLRLISRDNHT